MVGYRWVSFGFFHLHNEMTYLPVRELAHHFPKPVRAKIFGETITGNREKTGENVNEENATNRQTPVCIN